MLFFLFTFSSCKDNENIVDNNFYAPAPFNSILEEEGCACPPTSIATVMPEGIQWNVDTNYLKYSISMALSYVWGISVYGVEQIAVNFDSLEQTHFLRFNAILANSTFFLNLEVIERNGDIYLDYDYDEESQYCIKKIWNAICAAGKWIKDKVVTGPPEAQPCPCDCGRLAINCGCKCKF